MTGCRSKDDDDFANTFLFGNQELLIWTYLKLASFEFVDEDEAQDKVAANIFADDLLPSDYQRFTLTDFQELARMQLDSYNQSKHELGRNNFAGLNTAALRRQQMLIAQSLFFSGLFTAFVRFLLSAEERYFADACHIAVALQRLDLLKTKFLLTKLLLNSHANGIVR